MRRTARCAARPEWHNGLEQKAATVPRHGRWGLRNGPVIRACHPGL